MRFDIRDIVFESRGDPRWDVLLGIQADLEVTVRGRIWFHQPMFPVMELAGAADAWLRGSGDFVFDTVEAEESPFLWIREVAEGYAIGPAWQEHAVTEPIPTEIVRLAMAELVARAVTLAELRFDLPVRATIGLTPGREVPASHAFTPRPLAVMLPGKPYGPRFAADLQAIDASLSGAVAPFSALPERAGEQVLRLALEHACQAQNMMNIELGRAAILAMPRRFTLAALLRAADRQLDLNDEWEARRLLEVLLILDDELLLRATVLRLRMSENPEVRDAATEYDQ